MVSSSSITALGESTQYVPLRCNDNGNFTLYDDPDSDAVDVYNVKCTKKQYPALKKHKNEDILCSKYGADGRTDNLLNTIRRVQIGWNMSAMNPGPTELKEMVS